MMINKIKSNPKKTILFVILIIVVTSSSFKNIKINNTDKIGLIQINYPIITSKEIIDDLNYLNNENDIKGIIVSVESPGGSVAASQEIYEKIKNINDKSKPIFISMGNVAASGGFYLSMGADTIIANPGTLTGSIGVIIGYPTINKLMDSIGINYTTIKSGKLKDSGSMFRESNNNDKEYFQNVVDDLYDQFINVVSVERNLSYEFVEEISDGRVYSGKEAYNLGLIDIIGTLEDAINLLANKVSIKGVPIVKEPPGKDKSIIDYLLGEINTNTNIYNLYPKPEYRLSY